MIAVIQRVSRADISVAEQTVAEIKKGILALVGVEKSDAIDQVTRLSERLLNYRIFADESDRMNLNIVEITGDLLLIPQFTLASDTSTGNRPGFSLAAPPDKGKELFECFVTHTRERHSATQSGIFGADMQVSLINDGPATFILRTTGG